MGNEDFDCPQCGNGHIVFRSGISKKTGKKYAFWACDNWKGKCGYIQDRKSGKKPATIEKRNFSKPVVELSDEQQAIVDMAEELKRPGGRSLVIQAKAGTGKTFCLEMLCWELLEGDEE